MARWTARSSPLALALVFGARLLLPHFGLAPALFKLAVPVLVSLALIRLVVRVLAAAWPDSGAIKLTERLGSWIAWGATVLWIGPAARVARRTGRRGLEVRRRPAHAAQFCGGRFLGGAGDAGGAVDLGRHRGRG